MMSIAIALLLQLLLVIGVHAQNSNEDDNENWVVWMAVGIGAGISAVLVICGIVFCYCLGRRFCHWSTHPPGEEGRERLVEEDEDDLPSVGTENILMSGLSQTSFVSANHMWEIPATNVRISARLGRGAYGGLFDAEITLPNRQFARALVKIFEGGDLNTFRYEVELLKGFQHPRVGRMYGVVSQAVPYQLILELPMNGDLKTFLTKVSKGDDIQIGSRDLVQMVFDVACGLEYLHSIDHVHSDVAARNCMVTQKLVVKITDYGIGPDLFKKDYTTYKGSPNVPVRWLSPESLLCSIHNFESNVWSYGILFWEVMTYCVMPYLELNSSQVVVAVTQKDRTLLHPKQCPPQLFEFIETCWDRDPSQRPTMTKVCKELDKHLAVTEGRRVTQKPPHV